MRSTLSGLRALATLALSMALALGACSGDDGTAGGGDDTGGGGVLVTNAAPLVSIARPAQGAVIAQGEAITFSGTVSDDYDAPETLAISWTSDRTSAALNELPANSLGGTTFEASGLVAGDHLITLTATDSAGKVGSARVLITINEAPTAPEISVSPAAPSAQDDLVAEIITPASDPNRAPTALTYSYRWFKGGEFADVTGARVASALTASGETWQVRVRASDGLAEGPEATAEVTIGNGPPSCEIATIFPSAGDTDTEFGCRCSDWRDPEGDAAADRCQFFDGDTALGDEGSCTLDPALTDKGMELRCRYVPSDGSGDGEARESASVPVLNAPPSAPSAVLTPEVASALSELSCALGEPSTDADGDSLVYAASWVVNGHEDAASAGATVVAGALKTASGSAARKGDKVRCRLRASDGEADSAPGESAEITLDNAPPEVGVVLVMPVGGARIDETAVLACETQGAEDADGDSVTLTYTWYVNGEVVAGADSKHLDGASFDRDDSVACAITADDGEATSEPVESKSPVTIGNALPSLVSATLEPAEVSPLGLFTCVPQGWVDPDGDALEVSYAWYVVSDGAATLLPAETGGTYAPSALAPGEQVRCEVTPRNGLEAGAPVSSGLGTIVAPAPTAPVVEVVAPDGAAGIVRCDFVQVAEHFAGPVSYTYRWTVNGGDTFVGVATISTLSDCDLVTCQVEASDGVSTLSSEVASLLLPVGPACDTGEDCKSAVCNLEGGCGFVLASDSPCNDGDACTIGDHCDNGFCVAADFAALGAACDDGLFCTAGDSCDDAGHCVAGPDPCATGADSCVVGVCNEEEAKCVYSERPDETSCDDGDGCTDGDRCVGGACIPGIEVDCSAAGDACNAGVCESLSAEDYHCVSEARPSGVPCTSDDFCVVNAVCDGAGACGGGEPRDCQAEAGDTCNTATCDSNLAQCTRLPLPEGTGCDDEDPCTLVDTCTNGTCRGDDDVCVEDRLSISHEGNALPTLVSLGGGGRYAMMWWEHSNTSASGAVRVRRSSAYRAREESEGGVAFVFDDRIASGWQTRLGANAAGTHVGLVGKVTWNAERLKLQIGGRAWDYLGEELSSTADALSITQTPKASDEADWELRALPLATSSDAFGIVVRAVYPPSGGATVSPATARDVTYYPPSGPGTLGTARVLISDADLDGAHVAFDARSVPNASGDFVVAWVGPDHRTISLRRFSDAGIPKTQLAVSVATAPGDVRQLRVAPLADGGAFVAWDGVDIDGNGLGIQASLVAADGLSASAPVQVNAGFYGDQRLGELAAFGDGGAVIAYDDEFGDSDGYAVFAQRLSVDGALDGDALGVNTRQAGDQRLPSVVVVDTEEFVVGFVGADGVVWTRRYLRDGRPTIAWPERRVNGTTEGDQDQPSAAAMADGTTLVAYRSPVAGRADTEVLARLLDPYGAPLLPELEVNTITAGDQVLPAVGAGPSEFVVVWLSAGVIHGRRVDPSAGPVGDELTLQGDGGPVLAVSPSDGSFVIVYSHRYGNSWYFTARVYDAQGSPIADTLQSGKPLPKAGAVIPRPGGGFLFAMDSHYGLSLQAISAEGTWDGPAIGVSGFGGRPTLAYSPSGDSLVLCAHAGVEVDCVRLDPDSLSTLTAPFPLTSDLSSLDKTSLMGLALLDDERLVASWDGHAVDVDYGIITGQFSLSGVQLRPRLTANIAWSGEQAGSVLVTPTSTTALIVYPSDGLDGDGKGVAARLLPTY